MAPTPSPTTPPASASLRASVDGRVGRLTLSRPEKRNPLGTDTLDDIVTLARWFDEQRSVALEVPSAVVTHERNVLLNPLHPRFREVEVGERRGAVGTGVGRRSGFWGL